MVFQNAGQLVKGDQVQVGGRPIGSVKDIALTNHNLARVRVELNELTPLHQGTQAVIRETSLSGIANRYIALTPGPNSAPSLKDGATLPTTQTTTPVDLDQLFDTLDPRTRAGLQQVTQGCSPPRARRSPTCASSCARPAPTTTSPTCCSRRRACSAWPRPPSTTRW